jgi:hypothetical protein
MTKTVKIDFDAVRCDSAHLTIAGRGWARRLRELGADESESLLLRDRLREGMAAIIELARIKALAGVEP